MCSSDLHSIFEMVTREKLSDTAALERLQAEVAKISLEEVEKAELLAQAQESLKKSLAEFGDILRYDNARAEVNLSPERLNFNGVPLTGKIDHIAIDEDAKTIEVYDFKTGKYHPEKWNSHPTLYKMRLQLGFYKLLLNLSPTYRNYEVKAGHILFVTPDKKDDKVRDKIYEIGRAHV